MLLSSFVGEHNQAMCDDLACVAHRYEQPMHRASAAWCAYSCIAINWGFLPNEARERFTKSQVVACKVRIACLCSGQIHAHARSTCWCEALEDPFIRRLGPNKDMNAVGKVPERCQVQTFWYVDLRIEQHTEQGDEPTDRAWQGLWGV